MFVDKITLICKAGEGGRGCLSFRREAHVPRGGPDGGDGGDGGSIIVVANEHLNSLGHLAGHIHWNAERGRHGDRRGLYEGSPGYAGEQPPAGGGDRQGGGG